ncbi:MAG: FecR domain-containing protein [Pedobacter sp.]
MSQERFAYLFRRYVDKVSSPEELDELMALLRDPDQAYNVELVLDQIWNNSPDVVLEKSKSDDIFTKVIFSDLPLKKTGKIVPYRYWLSLAASIFIACIAAFLWFNNPERTDQVASAASVKAEIPPATPITITTTNEHQKITLPDGSTVVLNNNSSITYPSVFPGNKREVQLSGEGYFDINHDEKKSFTVFTEKIKTTVLGTAFNIKAYKNEEDITVTVTRGKVSVLGDKAVLSIITPNQQMVFNKNYQKHNVAKVVAKNSIQWQESDLYFDDISMEQATEILSKRFNIPITFKNTKVAKCRFTATFLKGESLVEILNVICPYNNAQYESVAGKITISGSGCDS